MKPLAKQFKKGGFDFTQIDRAENIALFSKQKGRGVPWSYEVVIVQQNAEREMGGVVIPAAESMPSSESWGTKGWSFGILGQAERLFNNLTGKATKENEKKST